MYAGPVTRFVVDLDGGGRLIALEENGHRASHDELRRGDPVELLWHREHLIEIPDQQHDRRQTIHRTKEFPVRTTHEARRGAGRAPPWP